MRRSCATWFATTAILLACNSCAEGEQDRPRAVEPASWNTGGAGGSASGSGGAGGDGYILFQSNDLSAPPETEPPYLETLACKKRPTCRHGHDCEEDEEDEEDEDA